MIYEVRTYTLKPGSVPTFEENFGKALPHRQKYSPLAAFWHTEVGPLNQVIHVWPYESLDERTRIRAEASQDPNWPPANDPDMYVNMESEIFIPAPFMRPLGNDQELGNIYEMRSYTYKTGSMGEVLKRWEAAVPHREEYSPLGRCLAHRAGRTEQVGAHLALQGPRRAQPGPRRGRQVPPLAAAHPRVPAQPGKQDHGAGRLLARPLGRVIGNLGKNGAGNRETIPARPPF